MVTIRDISHLERLEKQSLALRILDLTTSSVTHEMITPLRAVSCLSQKLSNTLKDPNQQRCSLQIHSTTQIILSHVKLLLDRSMLDRDSFQPTLDKYPINKTITDIVEICQLQAEMQKVTINLITLPKEVTLEIDLFRM